MAIAFLSLHRSIPVNSVLEKATKYVRLSLLLDFDSAPAALVVSLCNFRNPRGSSSSMNSTGLTTNSSTSSFVYFHGVNVDSTLRLYYAPELAIAFPSEQFMQTPLVAPSPNYGATWIFMASVTDQDLVLCPVIQAMSSTRLWNVAIENQKTKQALAALTSSHRHGDTITPPKICEPNAADFTLPPWA